MSRPRLGRLRAPLAVLATLLVVGCGVALLGTVFFPRLDRSLGAARWGMVAVTGLSHAAVYAGLFWLFARSLRPGRRPLVTAMAMRVHGRLTPRIAVYTRRVTQLWAGFAAFQIAGSLVLLLAAPRQWWAVFVNGLDLPLVLLVFVAEATYRRLRYPPEEVGTLAQSIRAARGAVRGPG